MAETEWLNQCHFGDCLTVLRGMPDGVRLKTSLPADVRAAVIAELQQSGIYPLNRTSE